MMKTMNSKEYYAAKRAAKTKLRNWKKTRWVVLPIVLPLVYFACYTSVLVGLTHNVQVDSDYDQVQMNPEFERREKILELKNTVYDTSVDLFNLYGESPKSCRKGDRRRDCPRVQ